MVNKIIITIISLLFFLVVRKLYENLKVPVFCKIRLLPSLDDTLQLARMLQDAGCQLLAVHGRTRDNKGLYCTPADWDSIRIVKYAPRRACRVVPCVSRVVSSHSRDGGGANDREALAIPVIANGNIAQFEDIEPCLEATRCEGVMAAWAALNNPALFSGPRVPDKVALALEYLDMCETYPTQPKSIRAHLCKLLKKQCVPLPQCRVCRVCRVVSCTDSCWVNAGSRPMRTSASACSRTPRRCRPSVRSWRRSSTASTYAAATLLSLQCILENPTLTTGGHLLLLLLVRTTFRRCCGRPRSRSRRWTTARPWREVRSSRRTTTSSKLRTTHAPTPIVGCCLLLLLLLGSYFVISKVIYTERIE
jgi:hypothetical protein